MKGWKTLLGGIGFMSIGIYQILNGNTQEGITNILTGLSIIGIGHKLDKNKNIWLK